MTERTIKFQAINKKTKRRYGVIAFGRLVYRDYPEGGFYDILDRNEGCNIWLNDETFPEPHDCNDYYLIQFTGIYDSTTWDKLTDGEQQDWIEDGNQIEYWKGKEIYEGDIIKFTFDGEVHTLPVEWSKIDAQFILFDKRFIAFEFKRCENVEIIGNIQESPELLKKDAPDSIASV